MVVMGIKLKHSFFSKWYIKSKRRLDTVIDRGFVMLRGLFNDFSTLPLIVIITSVFINLLSLGFPLVILQVYDRVIPNQSYDTLVFLLIGLGLIICLEAGLKIMRSYFLAHEASRCGFLSEVSMIRDILRAPSSEIERTPSTIWLERLESYVQHNKYYAGQLRLLVLDLPFAILFLVLIWIIAGPLVLVPLLLIGGFAGFTFYCGQHVKSLIQNQVQENAKKYDFITEILSGVHTVKSIAMEPQMMRRFERLQKTSTGLSYDLIAKSNVLATASAMVNLLSITTILAFGAYLVILDQMTIGSLACCTLLASRIMRPITQIMGAWSDIQGVLGIKDRIKPLHALQSSVVLPTMPDAQDMKQPITIRVENLNYKTETNGVWILKDLNFSIAAGETVCFCGPNDSGKTTLLKCLIGDIKAYEGVIYLDGQQDLKTAPEALTDRICYVSATMPGYQGTILDNLTMFQSDISSEAVHKIAQSIGLDAQIKLLPNGYHTLIGGYNTAHLPVGLIQKIAIARALLNTPRLLILDEITSRLDHKETHLLFQALQEIKGQCTLIITSNEPDIIRLSDRSFVMERGRMMTDQNATGSMIQRT